MILNAAADDKNVEFIRRTSSCDMSVDTLLRRRNNEICYAQVAAVAKDNSVI